MGLLAVDPEAELREGTDLHETGELSPVGSLAGSLTCVDCGYSLSASALEELPRCPACNGSRFRRARLFETPTPGGSAIAPAAAPPEWLEDVRGDLEPGCQYIAYEEDGEPLVTEVEEGWTRLGRSGAADIRLDDPTVSRRHALIVRTPDDQLRALDDRSLNGLFVNGKRVDWAPLRDGDELEVGRYRLYVLKA